MPDRVFNVLFLCTGNSARSIIAEAMLNTMGRGRFRAYSAGSKPAGQVNRYALAEVRILGYPEEGLRSKSWEELGRPEAPPMDFVITVCDEAAGEVCPVWPGHPITAHWSFPDPAKVAGDEEAKRRAFSRVAHQIATRIQLFCNLPLETLDRLAQETRVRAIGGSTAAPPT